MTTTKLGLFGIIIFLNLASAPEATGAEAERGQDPRGSVAEWVMKIVQGMGPFFDNCRPWLPGVLNSVETQDGHRSFTGSHREGGVLVDKLQP